MLRRREKHEGLFWLLYVIGLAVSVPFVMFDDGWRVLSGSFPLLAVLVACGFTSPLHSSVVARQADWVTRNIRLCIAFGSVAVLCIIVPAIIYQGDWLGRRRIPELVLEKNEEIFLGTRRMSGFLVMPDGEQLPRNVPSIHQSEFVQIVRNSGIEQYQALVTPAPIYQPPFAIVSAIPVHHKAPGLMVLPPEVFLTLDDGPWLFRFTIGKMWSRVTEARPLMGESR